MSDLTNKNIQLLSSYLMHYGIDIPKENLKLVVKHTELVLEKNKVVNLTSIKDVDKALILHVLDSLLFLKEMTPQELLRGDKKKVLDLGTGGGYPGIPIASCSSYEVVLLDSVGKKIKACQEFTEKLGLSDKVSAIHSRFEEYALKHRREFDFVVARAVAPLDVLIEYAEPLIKMNGMLVFSKGNPSPEELINAEKVARLCGFENVSRETFDLPENFGHRELFTYIKKNQSGVKLPRRNGEAKNKPLAAR